MNKSILTMRVILFANFLRKHGFKVASSNILASVRSLGEISILRKEDFFNALRVTLVMGETEWRIFGELFEQFWEEIHGHEKAGKREDRDEKPGQADGERGVVEILPEIDGTHDQGEEDVCRQDSMETASYSPLTKLGRREFRELEKNEIRAAQLILKQMVTPFKLSTTRRFRKSKRMGDIDFRRIIQASLKLGDISSELLYRKKKKRIKKLVIIADISGSMDRYVRFIMPFMLGSRKLGPRVETFVFSTSLTRITPIIRRFGIDKTLAKLSQEVPDWSGGTRIGSCLHRFISEYEGKGLLNNRTIVVIVSDGWDLGPNGLLVKAMESLKERVYCIIWLNPLAGERDYQPICKGMQAALPYIDHFLPANSLQSLNRIGKALSRVVAR